MNAQTALAELNGRIRADVNSFCLSGSWGEKEALDPSQLSSYLF